MTRTTRPSRHAIAAIAKADVTDRIRAGLGASVLVQPALLLLVLLMGVVAPTLSSVKLGERSWTVAVDASAPTDGPAPQLLAEVTRRHPRFVLKPGGNVADVVAGENAATGVVVVPAAEGPAELRVVALPSRRASKVAAAELTDALRRLLLEQSGVAAPTIVRTTLQRSGEAGRIGLAGLLPFLVAFQLVSLFGEASIRMRGGKTDRSAEVMHVLPVHRLDLVLGRAVVGVGDGIVRLAAMMLIAASLPLVPPSIATFSLPAVTIAILAAAGLCQILVATAGGSLLGALVRTEGQENAVAAVVTLGLSFGFLGLTFASAGPLPGAVALVPFVGPISWARNAFFGSASAVEGVVALVVSVASAAAFLAMAARALGRDGVTLRET